MEINLAKLLDVKMITTFGLKLIGAIAIWVIGVWVINFIEKQLKKGLKKKATDPALTSFLTTLAVAILKVLVGISALGFMGIGMTSFIAVLGAAGLAVGMALSGTLQNFAGGVIILLLKPFKIGDLIQTDKYLGIVSEIQIFNTILKSPDNKTIIVPNGGLSTSSLINYSTEEKRRVDWTFGIGYGDNTEKARGIITELANADSRILKDPAIFIAVSELGDSSVNFTVRGWVKSADYWGVFFDMNEKVYNAFNKSGINIPFPQMDVHLHQ
ncbi:MAG: mechanosensitive ion channel protein MscS [Paludibacter sp.]|nr:MAG: mechanosensitive ion channel protein MscS [Paludibacter sp.]